MFFLWTIVSFAFQFVFVPPAFGFVEGLTTVQLVTKCYTGPQNWWSLVSRI